jgi:Domain of unknown function (DUF305)
MTLQDEERPAAQGQSTPRDCLHSSLRAVFAVALVAAVALAARGEGPTAGPDGFRVMIAAAVARMHVAMDVPFSGDADRDFARMMIPHHQGAIDMALAELRFGRDKRLRRLAQEIIVDQQQEIVVMRLALGDSPTPGTPASTQVLPPSRDDRVQ